MKFKKNYLLLAIFLLALISSIILGMSEVPLFCDGTDGCHTVQSSSYAYFLGIKNSTYGILIFTFLSIISFLNIKNPTESKKRIISLGIIIGSLIALYFIYLQIYILEAFCKYCMVIDTSLIIGLIILFAMKN